MMKKIVVALTCFLLIGLMFGCTEVDNDQNNSTSDPPLNFQDYVTRNNSVNHRANYELVSSFSEGEPNTGKLSVYTIGTDFKIHQNLETGAPYAMEAMNIVHKGERISCVKQEAGWVCYSKAPMVIPKNEYFLTDIGHTERAKIAYVGKKILLSENTNCFNIDYETDNYDVCFTDDGIIAKMAHNRAEEWQTPMSAIKTEMIAIMISRNVTTSDIDPPSETQPYPFNN
ncbi:MAG: hypothetical protein HOE11_03190 [Candidatus Diapherotrites archaeon]|jgi:hypothetical protein|nr:hypothetical protein [Candidatus Diapherotrites archaeon]MBT4596675.1 hypothetical protein [Candidatus Diapherotrites archaeon]